ncbi:hypothetical protein H4R24_000558 [Coemansia sp. RSA 988]|nr:hypothetical protein H4R24_000558 [Coemansia sp. RSA 988]
MVSATTCAFEAREINISALGSAAEGYFGCTAAQWVEETDRWLRVLGQRWKGGDSAALVGYMAERLAAVIELAAGTAGLCAFVELRQTPFTAANRSRRTTQLSATRILPVSGTGKAPLKMLTLWRFAVYEALCAVQADGSSQLFRADTDTGQLLAMLGTDARSLFIAEELGAPCSTAEFSVMTIDHDSAAAAAGRGTAQTIDSYDILANWDDVSTRQTKSMASHKLGKPKPIENINGSQMTIEADEINYLLENSSELFVFSPETTEIIDGDDPLSMQLFEESIRDEHLHSMFVDSQQLLDVTESQLSQYSDLVGFDSSRALWSAPGVYQTPVESPIRTPVGSFMRNLVDTPLSASLGSGPEIPSNLRLGIPRSLPPLSNDGSLAPDLQRGPSSEDKGLLVLADETPMASSSGSKRKLDFFVPETPLATRGIGQFLPDTPTRDHIADITPLLRRSASADRTWSIPETPAVRSKRLLDNPTFNSSASGAVPIRRLHEYRPLAMVDDYKPDKAEPPGKRWRRGSLAASRPLLVRMPSEASDLRINPLCLYASGGSSINNRGDHAAEDGKSTQLYGSKKPENKAEFSF